ncbi:MAG: hypothetical protein Q8S03_10310 [Brevundimonas sp.]|uniref:hypothetical protein n=1 Tax=Brevundimonas sp. TaxID=1871086 RepID=UPI00273400FA|nr:hypothetical protein [Brevundimonas sp.]MDP3405072.1 hypothetical protein [Brevundimonas sp.]
MIALCIAAVMGAIWLASFACHQGTAAGYALYLWEGQSGTDARLITARVIAKKLLASRGLMTIAVAVAFAAGFLGGRL